jgi:hypothetical protein
MDIQYPREFSSSSRPSKQLKQQAATPPVPGSRAWRPGGRSLGGGEGISLLALGRDATLLRPVAARILCCKSRVVGPLTCGAGWGRVHVSVTQRHGDLRQRILGVLLVGSPLVLLLVNCLITS